MHRTSSTSVVSFVAKIAAAACLGLAALPSLAQGYPAKPVQIVVPFAAGGPADALARALGEQLAASMKQSFVIVNQPGAAGNLGGKAAALAQPDGYTLLFSLDAALTSNPVLYGERMGFDPIKDLRPITTLVSFGQTLGVHPSLKVSTLAQFIELAGKKDLTYASAGNGSTGHLGMALLAHIAKVKMTHVPYKGAGPALIDMIGGQVDAGFLVTPGVAPHARAGKLVPLAVSSDKRSTLLPQVPTVAEAGYPGATLEFSMMLLAPAKTPDAIVQQLQQETRKAMATPALRKMVEANDYDPVAETPAQAAARLASMTTRMKELIQTLGIKLQ